MEQIAFTLFGFGIGFLASQFAIQKQKQQTKKQIKQDKLKPTNKTITIKQSKYLPSTPDLKKAYQMQQSSVALNPHLRQEVTDNIRKMVKLDHFPAQFTQDDELQLTNCNDKNENNNEQEIKKLDELTFESHIDQQSTPNFWNKPKTPQKTCIISSQMDPIQNNFANTLLIKVNQFSIEKQQPDQTSSQKNLFSEVGENQNSLDK